MKSLEHWWHDIDGGKPKYSEHNMSTANFPTTNLTRNILGPVVAWAIAQPCKCFRQSMTLLYALSTTVLVSSRRDTQLDQKDDVWKAEKIALESERSDELLIWGLGFYF